MLLHMVGILIHLCMETGERHGNNETCTKYTAYYASVYKALNGVLSTVRIKMAQSLPFFDYSLVYTI